MIDRRGEHRKSESLKSIAIYIRYPYLFLPISSLFRLTDSLGISGFIDSTNEWRFIWGYPNHLAAPL